MNDLEIALAVLDDFREHWNEPVLDRVKEKIVELVKRRDKPDPALPDAFLGYLEGLALEAHREHGTMPDAADVDFTEALKFDVVPGRYKRVGNRQWSRVHRGSIVDLLKMCVAGKRAIGLRLRDTMFDEKGDPMAMLDFGFFDQSTGKPLMTVQKVHIFKKTFAMLTLDATAEIPHDSPLLKGEAAPWHDLSGVDFTRIGNKKNNNGNS